MRSFITFLPNTDVSITDINNIQGGSHIVNTIVERNSIPIQLRKIGMIVTILSENLKKYELVGGIQNTNWVEYVVNTSSGGGTTLPVPSILTDFILESTGNNTLNLKKTVLEISSSNQSNINTPIFSNDNSVSLSLSSNGLNITVPQIADLLARIEALESLSGSGNLNNKVTSLENEVNSLDNKITSLENETNSLENEIDNLIGDTNDLLLEADNYETSGGATENQINDLKDKKDELETKKDDLKDKKDDLKDKKDELETKKDELKEDIENLENEINNSNIPDDIKDDLQNKLDELKEDIEEIETKIDEIDIKIEEIDNKIEEVDTKIDEIETKIETLENGNVTPPTPASSWTKYFALNGGLPKFFFENMADISEISSDLTNENFYGNDYDGVGRKIRLYVTHSNSDLAFTEPGDEIPLDGIDPFVTTATEPYAGEYRAFSFRDHDAEPAHEFGGIQFVAGGAYNRMFKLVYDPTGLFV
jgi:predicted  nucleic acid-binding Zn-ribbon protein